MVSTHYIQPGCYSYSIVGVDLVSSLFFLLLIYFRGNRIDCSRDELRLRAGFFMNRSSAFLPHLGGISVLFDFLRCINFVFFHGMGKSPCRSHFVKISAPGWMDLITVTGVL